MFFEGFRLSSAAMRFLTARCTTGFVQNYCHIDLLPGLHDAMVLNGDESAMTVELMDVSTEHPLASS